MEWSDDGIILSVRPSGESAGIVTLFTPTHGKWLGRVAGAQSPKRQGWLTPGNSAFAHWGARLEEQLGTYRIEPTLQRTAHAFDAPQRLLALSYLTQLTDETVTERLPLPLLYDAFSRACDTVIAAETVGAAVIDYERKLLEHLGYGLDLTSCAATGSSDQLIYISPNTGRAVSAGAGEPYADRLLPLPDYWLSSRTPEAVELKFAARTTGFFLTQHFYTPPRELPKLRAQVL